MTTYKDWYIFSVSVALLACRLVLAEGITYSLKPQAIEPGQRTILEVRLPITQAKQTLEEDITVQDTWLMENKHFQILDKTFVREGQAFLWQYQLTSYEPGQATIPPIEITAGPDSYSTEQLHLEVSTTRSPLDVTLRKGFGAVELPFSIPSWVWWVILTLLSLSVSSYLLRLLHRKFFPKKEEPPAIPHAPPESPEEWLRKQLLQLKTQYDANQTDPYLIDQLTAILRQYFSKRLGAPVECWTTQEFMQALEYDAQAKKLFSLFKSCDQFKFSGKAEIDPEQFTPARIQESERALF